MSYTYTYSHTHSHTDTVILILIDDIDSQIQCHTQSHTVQPV